MTRKLPLVISLFLLAIAATALTASASSPQASSSQSNSPDATCPADGQCFADVLPSNPFYTFINRIYQQDLVSGYACGGPGEPCDDQSRPYYPSVNNVIR